LKIESLIWFDEIIEKLSGKHHVHQNEAEKFYQTNLISGLLKKDIAQEIMSMQQWGRLTAVVISLYSLFIKLINVL